VEPDSAVATEFERDGIVTEMHTVNLPTELCVRAEKKFGERFGSLEKLLEYVLEDLLRDDAAQADEREQRIIEQRLKELGYL
jgi:hypothetical protein